jgi:hypothetical protein
VINNEELSMIKCNGREAISILAEVEAEKHRELTKGEQAYVEMQANSFVVWLSQQPNMTMEKAKEIRERIFESEVKLLKADDPYSDFVWSRPGDEVGDLEIDLAGSLGADFEVNSNQQHFLEQEYWNQMERTAERGEGKYSPDQWKASQNKLDDALEVIKPYQLRLSHNLTLGIKDMNYLRKVNARVNELRFGRAPVFMHRHWCIIKNALNELLGHSKRYAIKEVPEKTEDEKIDAMDNAVYGYFDNNQLFS